MATLSKPYTFASGGYAVAAQVNADLDTLYAWVNGGGAMWNDGSTSFTAVPSGPATDPTSPNQLVRKSYVDTLLGGTGLRLKFGSSSVTTNAGGGGTVTYPAAFPTGVAVVLAQCGDWSGNNTPEVTPIFGSGYATTGFNLRVNQNGVAMANSTVRVNWIAVGS
jgi:hypothetical protein